MKSKIVKWNLFITFSWFFISLIITIAYLGAPDLQLYAMKSEYYASSVVLFITSIISFILVIRLYSRNKAKKNAITEIMMGVFIATGVMTLIQGFFGLNRYYVNDIPGLSQDQFIFQQFWFNASYYLLLSAIFGLLCFVLETFYDGLDKKKNQKIMIVYATYFIGFCVFLLKHTLFGASDLEFAIPSAILLLLGMSVFISLVKNSFSLYKRIDEELAKIGLLWMGIAGILLISGMVGNFLFNILYESQIEIVPILTISDFLFTLAYCALYYGFTRPLRKN